MENQHQKIKGYRDLSQAEIDLLNEIKAKSEELEALYRMVFAHVGAQRLESEDNSTPDEDRRLNAAQPERWMNIGRTHLQEGLMALTRAVAQPTHF